MSNTDEMSNPDDMDELEEMGIESSSSMPKPNQRKKSVVWDEFDVVTGSDMTGVTGAKCSHCKNILAYKRGGATSHLKRHLKVCVPRRVAESGNKKVPSKLCCHLRLKENQGKLCYQPINMTKTKFESFLLRCYSARVPF